LITPKTLSGATPERRAGVDWLYYRLLIVETDDFFTPWPIHLGGKDSPPLWWAPESAHYMAATGPKRPVAGDTTERSHETA
jgi:hypothetical protein